jgi:hypothetical protein
MLEAAIESYRQAVQIDDRFFEAYSNLSTALLASGRPEEALVAADRAVELAPERPGARLNRANARRDAGDLDGAAQDYRRAVELDSDYAEGWSSLANVYHDQGEWSLALDAHDRAVRLAPEVPQVRWNRSFTLLATAQLEAGWADYESRLLTAAAAPEPRDFPWPVWQGEPLAGKRILICREQGLGDEVLFAACLPLALALGARVTFLASPRLVTLFGRAFPAIDVRPDQQGSISGEAFDCYTPLASLPRWLGMTRPSFEVLRPFLAPDPAQATKWEDRLAGLGPGLRLGICWRSGLVTPERRRHYPPLEAWEPVFTLPGVTLVNLQYDECEPELELIERAHGARVHRWGDNLKDDLETVIGLLSRLDAVISAPTAITSFAGAAGVPTWQVDSGSDWTVFGEDRSPWFPSIRVLRKPPLDRDWGPVLSQAAEAVRVLDPAGRPKVF